MCVYVGVGVGGKGGDAVEPPTKFTSAEYAPKEF